MARPFRTERTAAADVNGRGKGLQQRDLQRQTAFTVQDRLNRFGDAVSPNLVGTIARHQPNDYAADDRNGHHDRTKSCVSDIDGISGEATEPEKVRSEERSVGKECVRKCRARRSPYN